MKFKDILITLLGIIIAISALTLIFKKKFKAQVVSNIDSITLRGSIIYVSSFKDDYGSGIKTKIQNYDTSFCFSGFSSALNMSYPEFAKKGDIIVKDKNANVFYLIRNDSTFSFVLSRCQ